MPARKLSDRGAKLIAEFEGFRSCPYRDPVGVWTIGYGSTKGVGPNSKCVSREQALARMRREVGATYGQAVNDLAVDLNQNQYDALTSFVYNLGPGAISPSTGIGRALRRKNWDAAADEMLEWNKAGGNVLPGLVRRRKAERTLFKAKPPPPPIRYDAEEKKYLGWLKKPGQNPKAKEWLTERAEHIREQARAVKDGWKKHDRRRRYDGIRRALKRYG